MKNRGETYFGYALRLERERLGLPPPLLVLKGVSMAGIRRIVTFEADEYAEWRRLAKTESRTMCNFVVTAVRFYVRMKHRNNKQKRAPEK